MERILEGGSVSQKTKRTLLYLMAACALLGTILLVVNYLVYNDGSNTYFMSAAGHRTENKPDYMPPDIASTYSLRYEKNFCQLPCFFGAMIFWGMALLFAVLYFMLRQMQIVVTDKRIHGKAYFGRSVDLPVDSITAIGLRPFQGITVATSSGKISFFFIARAEKIYEEICNLIINRQSKAVPEESSAPYPNR